MSAGTFKNGVEDVQLAQAVCEFGIFYRGVPIGDSPVKSPERLLESVVIPFAVPSRKVGVITGISRKQRGVFDDQFVWLITTPDP